MLSPEVRRREAVVVEQVLPSEDLAQPLPEVLAGHPDHEVALVRTQEGAVGDDVAVRRADRPGNHTGTEVLRRLPEGPGHRGVEEGHVDVLADPGPRARGQRGEDPDHAPQRGPDIGNGV